jgi:hypothetical protein
VRLDNAEHLTGAFVMTSVRVAQEIKRPESWRGATTVHSLDPASMAFTSIADPGGAALDRLVRAELLRWLAGAEVSEPDRLLLTLAAQVDSGDQLAELLGTSRDAAYHRLSRSRRRVRAQLVVHFGEPLAEVLEPEQIAA